MEKVLEALGACPLFDGLTQADTMEALSCMGANRRCYEKGETILSEGEPARLLGIVLSGAVQIERMDYYGNRSILSKLGVSDLFAEAFACADIEAMPVDVMAAERTEVLLISAERILHPCAQPCAFHQQMIYNLMRNLAAKNLAFHRKAEITAQRTTRGKLMTYLMLEAKRAGSSSFEIPFDRQALADYLGVDRSGLSTEIGRLRREGVLACVRSRFTLLKP